MENLYKVSVIIPVYNGEKYLKKCLNSIGQQTFPEFELIIINDGSTDRSQQIIDEFSHRTVCKVNSVEKENQGQAAARNQGVLLAQGKYVVFIDCDDYVEKDYLEVLYHAAEDHGSDVVSCGYHYVDENGTRLRDVKLTSRDWELYGRAGLFAVWGKIFRRDFILEKKMRFPENGKIFEDAPYSISAKFLGKNPIVIAYNGYYYIRRKGSTMNSGTVKSSRFPYEKMTESIDGINRIAKGELRERFEFEILHFFSGFLFRYCRRADKKDIKVLVKYSESILKRYFPDYYKNSYMRVWNNTEQPFVEKCAVRTFSLMNRIGLLYYFTFLFTRF